MRNLETRSVQLLQLSDDPLIFHRLGNMLAQHQLPHVALSQYLDVAMSPYFDGFHLLQTNMLDSKNILFPYFRERAIQMQILLRWRLRNKKDAYLILF